VILIPVRTVAGLNAREHHYARARRVKAERDATGWALKGRPIPATPCSVLLVRVSPAHVAPDDDSVVGALKGVRDAVADWLGVNDRDRATVRYAYAHEKGPWGVRIEFGPHCEGCALAERDDPCMYVANCPACRARMLADLSTDNRVREANGA